MKRFYKKNIEQSYDYTRLCGSTEYSKAILHCHVIAVGDTVSLQKQNHIDSTSKCTFSSAAVTQTNLHTEK